MTNYLEYWPTATAIIIICILFVYEQKCIWEDKKTKKDKEK